MVSASTERARRVARINAADARRQLAGAAQEKQVTVGFRHVRPTFDDDVMALAPGYSLRDVNDWTNGRSSGERLVPQTNALDSKSLGGEFAVPVFLIQGAEDFTTPTSLARSFVNSIRAPHKAFVPIEGGHFAVFMKSRAFLNELVARVLPLVKG